MHVVLLLGPSSAGKSTLCQELVSTQGWKSLSIDEIMDKLYTERSEQVKSIMLEELNKQGLIQKLQPQMTEEEVLLLCGRGILTLSNESHLIPNQAFPNPSLPNLEEVLERAGFKQGEISELAKDLRLVTKIGHPMERLYDETFTKSNDQDVIILDVVPNSYEDESELLNRFEERAELYRQQNIEHSLVTSMVLAYCPPQKLSERIQKRNLEASIPKDKREGMFPFYQLANLVTVKDSEPNTQGEHPISRNYLILLVHIVKRKMMKITRCF